MSGYESVLGNLDPFERARLDRLLNPRFQRQKRLAKGASVPRELEERKRTEAEGGNDD